MEKHKEILKSINKIKSSDKKEIDTITYLADELKSDSNFVECFADDLMKRILQAKCERLKLVYFHIIDSILKNIGDPYQNLFAKDIVKCFVETFKACKDNETKVKLGKLRKTWTDEYFEEGVLAEIDLKIRFIDPNWALMSKSNIPDRQGQKRRSNVEPSLLNNQSLRKISKPSESDFHAKIIDYINKSSNAAFHFKSDLENKVDENSSKTDNLKHEGNIFNNAYDNMESESNKKWSTTEILGKLSQIPDHLLTEQFNYSNAHYQERNCNDVPFICNTSSFEVMKSMDTSYDVPFVNQKIFSQDTSATHFVNNTNHFDENPSFNHFQPNSYDNVAQDLAPNTHKSSFQFYNCESNEKYLNDRFSQKKYPPYWINRIDGFPMMPKIGIDPRLLTRLRNPKNPVQICVDDHEFVVLLNRIHPCVFHQGNYHAIRFICSYIPMIIDDVEMELSVNEVNFIKVRNVQMTLVIGGPFHEIILNGQPYNLPMDGNRYSIDVQGNRILMAFKVRKPFKLKLMDFIPNYIYNWVDAGYFGHPKDIHFPPMNPLNNPSLKDSLSQRYRNELQGTRITEIENIRNRYKKNYGNVVYPFKNNDCDDPFNGDRLL